MTKRILDFAAAHAFLYKVGTQTSGKYPDLRLGEPAEELMLALFGEIKPADEQRLRYIVFDLYQYAKSIEWDGIPEELRNFDGYNPGGFNRAQSVAWCTNPQLSAWKDCFKALSPEYAANVNDSVACVAQDVARTFLHTFNTAFGLSMYNVQMAAIRRNSEELWQLLRADRKLFVYSQLKTLLAKRGFRVREPNLSDL